MPRSSNRNSAVLSAIRAVVGPAGMADLYAERGGTEICIPIECGDDHWMVRLFDEKKADEICARFRVINSDGDLVGVVRAYVPMINSRVAALHEKIEEEVKQALIAGKAPQDICREVGISERKVREHLKLLRNVGIFQHRPEKKKRKALAVLIRTGRSERLFVEKRRQRSTSLFLLVVPIGS